MPRSEVNRVVLALAVLLTSGTPPVWAKESMSSSVSIEAGGGFTTNAAQSPNESDFLGFQLSERFRDSSSSLSTANVELQSSGPIVGALQANAKGAAGCTNYHSAHFVDECQVSAALTISREFGRAAVSVSANGKNRWIAGDLDYFNAGLGLSLRYPLSDRWRLILETGGSVVDTQAERLEELGVRRYLSAVGVNSAALNSRGLRVGLFVLAGGDDPLRARSTFGNERLGLRVAAEQTVFGNALAFGEFFALRTDYDGRTGFFFRDRIDELVGLNLGLRWQMDAAWQWEARLKLLKADSTIDIFSYDRAELVLLARRRWAGL